MNVDGSLVVAILSTIGTSTGTVTLINFLATRRKSNAEAGEHTADAAKTLTDIAVGQVTFLEKQLIGLRDEMARDRADSQRRQAEQQEKIDHLTTEVVTLRRENSELQDEVADLRKEMNDRSTGTP